MPRRNHKTPASGRKGVVRPRDLILGAHALYCTYPEDETQWVTLAECHLSIFGRPTTPSNDPNAEALNHLESANGRTRQQRPTLVSQTPTSKHLRRQSEGLIQTVADREQPTFVARLKHNLGVFHIDDPTDFRELGGKGSEFERVPCDA